MIDKEYTSQETVLLLTCYNDGARAFARNVFEDKVSTRTNLEEFHSICVNFLLWFVPGNNSEKRRVSYSTSAPHPSCPCSYPYELCLCEKHFARGKCPISKISIVSDRPAPRQDYKTMP